LGGVQDAGVHRDNAAGKHEASLERDDAAEAENLRLRQELLVVRDDLIGHEARLGEALGRIELLEADLGRYRDAVAEAERLLGTRTGRLLRGWHHLRAALRT
jgi:hypothetical protein